MEPEALKALDEWQWPSRAAGRPAKTLPPPVAQRVLRDLEAGQSPRSVEAKYRATPWSFSRSWLRDACETGRLEQMAHAH